jgi:polyhydroxyalkanoate synthesis regulator phasin
MDAPGNGGDPERDALERLAGLLGPRLEELRSVFGDAGSRWRGERVRVGEGTRHRVQELARELGLVTREEWDELELRVAQLEHRLRLLEDRDRP